MTFLGLDFGTANTSVALGAGAQSSVISLGSEGDSVPSTLFFDFDDNSIQVGSAAFERYYDGDRGRFLRSFKSALGTSTIDHTIRIKRDTFSIKEITQMYLARVVGAAQSQLGSDIESIVVGRPVNFVDDNPAADRQAEADLREIVLALGFKNVEFQLEPIAAALNYGATLQGAETVLVIDIGAGTSDFSVVNFSRNVENKNAQVISNCGIHIGGNDFDKCISLDKVMPNFGYGHRFKRGNKIELPRNYYLNASSWHLIDRLYERKALIALKELQHQIAEPELIGRLIEVVEHRAVHKILAAVEDTKKHFASNDSAEIDLGFIFSELALPITISEFQQQIHPLCEAIIQTANEAVTLASLHKSQIDSVYVTGGSMGIRHLYSMVASEFVDSTIIDGDRATAVARGLALDAIQKFK